MSMARSGTTRTVQCRKRGAAIALVLGIISHASAAAAGWFSDDDDEADKSQAQGEIEPPVSSATGSTPPAAPPAGTSPEANATESATLRAPETELALAKTTMANLRRKLEASRQLATQLGLGPQLEAAERSYKHAIDFFGHQEWLSTIRELNHFLNQTQVPAPSTYLKSQYMLGRSYEELNLKSSSLRAYGRYLAAFLTATANDHPDHDELVDVLRHMLPLAATQRGDARTQRWVAELLAGITTLQLPADVEPQVFYLAAKAGVMSGATAMAKTWLERAARAPNDPILKARSLYLQALLALAAGQDDRAEELLSQVIQEDPEGSAKDQARLALARLAVRGRRRELALKYYSMVSDGSPAYQDSIFESIYVHLDLKQDEEVRAKAQQYVARWPEASDALLLRTLLAYLDMRAGDLSQARAQVASADQRLVEIKTWVNKNLATRSSVDQATLVELLRLTQGQLALTPATKDGLELFGRLSDAKRRLADLRGELRQILFAIGRGNVADLNPQLANRGEQLAELGEELLKVGHRLAASERWLYDSQLTKVERQLLTASQARRTRLLSPAAEAHRKLKALGNLPDYYDLNLRLATAHQRLIGSLAEIVAARYQLQSNPQIVNPQLRQQRLDELNPQILRAAGLVTKSLIALRRRHLKDLRARGPDMRVRQFLLPYLAVLSEEQSVLARARDRSDSPAARLTASDSDGLWRQFEDLGSDLLSQLDLLGQDTAKGFGNLLGELDQLDARARGLEGMVVATTRRTESALGRSLVDIVGGYVAAIDARFARHQKWRADMDWITFQNRDAEAKKIDDHFDLEQQILKDHLSDLNQGALWQWPK